MMKKPIQYILGILAALLLVYFSLDIQNLEKYKAKATTIAFNATEYASRFWEVHLPKSIEGAPEVTTLIKSLDENPGQAFEKYGHKLGISKTYYFMLKGTGTIESVENEYLVISVGENDKLRIATDFIFGNAVRDGSGRVDIDDFLNMTDFNNVSVAIDKLVKDRVVSRLKKVATPGRLLEFAGATEIREDQVKLDSLLVIPVLAKISDGKTE
jgi:predicted lipoprotein